MRYDTMLGLFQKFDTIIYGLASMLLFILALAWLIEIAAPERIIKEHAMNTLTTITLIGYITLLVFLGIGGK